MVIYLTSTRPAKVEGARAAIEAIAARDDRFRDAEIRTRDLGDAGPAMPMTEAAILAGVRRRVEALLAWEPDAGVRRYLVGLEGGLDPLQAAESPGWFALKTWACVSDGRMWSYGAGPAIVLPRAVSAEVAAGRELGEVIDGLAGTGTRDTRGAWGVLTRDLVSRRDAFRAAVISAFAPFYNSSLYD